MDQALTLEASGYKGPMLPRDQSARGYWRDARTMRCVNMIKSTLLNIAGNGDRITSSTVLPNYPVTEMYVIDCILDMEGKLSLKSLSWGNKKFAILIHLPEHYMQNENILVGPQAMRKRHIKLAGFVVVSLDYQTLNLYKMYPDKLKDYITTRIDEGLKEH